MVDAPRRPPRSSTDRVRRGRRERASSAATPTRRSTTTSACGSSAPASSSSRARPRRRGPISPARPSRGDRTITVDDAAGWQVGDEIVITPTEPTTVEDHWEHHDRRTGHVGRRHHGSRLDRPLDHPHPEVTVRAGVTHRAEVLNLTRNVVISGTPEGRSHVIMLAPPAAAVSPTSACATWARGRATRRSSAATPSTSTPTTTARAARSSRASSSTTRPATPSRPTSPNGVTFRECIAHDLVDDAFWWDLSLDGGGATWCRRTTSCTSGASPTSSRAVATASST